MPARVLADDEERLAVMRAMKICAAVMGGSADALFHDPTAADDED